MENKPEHGYLVLADISGFIAFLAGVELEHAQAILQELIELLTQQLEPVLTVSQRFGDAVLAYAPDARVARGETLLEVIEATYRAYRERLDGIRRNTTCTCRACQAVPDLELNFMLHHGRYMLNQVAGQASLLGLDVELVRRRLLKDALADEASPGGFALITQPSLELLGIADQDLPSRMGTYPGLGELRTVRVNLREKYRQAAARRVEKVEPETANATLSRDFALSPSRLWDWLNDPRLRSRWMKGRRWTAGLRPGGRTGVGARNHCSHGVGSLNETILDWKPFDYMTVDMAPSSMPFTMRQTYLLEPLDDGRGTRLRIFIRLHGTMPEWLARPLCSASAMLIFNADLERLARVAQSEEAPLPASA